MNTKSVSPSFSLAFSLTQWSSGSDPGSVSFPARAMAEPRVFILNDQSSQLLWRKLVLATRQRLIEVPRSFAPLRCSYCSCYSHSFCSCRS